MTDLEFNLRLSDIDESMKKLIRDVAEMREATEQFITLLRGEAERWESRWEAERIDHESSIKHFEKVMNEDVS